MIFQPTILGGAEIEVPAWKRNVWEIYRQNWVNPAYGDGTKQPGCWYNFTVGDVEFFRLDGCYCRTDPKVVEPSMLGSVQKTWLLKMLKQSTATFKILCSPVPWTFGAKGNSLNTWNGFQAEREGIFGHIEQNRLTGVILISADRHRSDAWRIKRPNGYDLYEFNSSRLTNQHVHKTMPFAIFSYNQKQSFGLVNIDTICQPPTVTYQVVNIEGEIIETLVVSLEQLQF